MEENKNILLPSKKYAKAPELDQNIQVNLDNSQNLLRIGDRDIVIDNNQQYNDERIASIKYKLYGKINIVFRNMYTGSTPYEFLTDKLYYNGDGTTGYEGYLPYDEFAFLRRDVYRELNNPRSGGINMLTGFTPNITLTGFTGHTPSPITPIEAPYHNWNLYLSYVSGSDSSLPMSYTLSGGTEVNFTSGDGIPFRVVDMGLDYQLTSPIPHGIKQGEHILLSGGTTSHTNYTGSTFYINSVGNATFDSENYVITISKSQFQTGSTIAGTTIVLGKRVTDINDITGTTCQYYVQKLKTITDVNGYIMDKVGFENPIFENERKLLYTTSNNRENALAERNRPEVVLYDFKEPFYLSGLTNNLGFAPTEVYVSAIFRNGNGYFNYRPKVGYKFNFHNTWIDSHFDGNSSLEKSMTGNTYTFSGATAGFTFTGGTALPIGTILTGAYVEYSKKEMNERIITPAYHKITNPTHIFDYGQTGNTTTFTGATPTNPFGIFYQPHYQIKLRQLSPYVETANTNQIYGLPENAIYDSNSKTWAWRDLYDPGFVDGDGYGTNYPFVNGQHYVKTNINFYLRNEVFYNNKQNGITDFNDKPISNC